MSSTGVAPLPASLLDSVCTGMTDRIRFEDAEEENEDVPLCHQS
jgi:hypothetical protein